MTQTNTEKTFVLVHGAFHGGWCWKPVARRLRAMGHQVHTPTLTGLGERSHLLTRETGLDTWIEDLLQVFRYEELKDVILVGHSFAGTMVSAMADRIPDRLRHLVYLDAMVLQPGQSPMDTTPAGTIERYTDLAMQTSGGLTVPPNPPAYYGITDPVQAKWQERMMTPHPLRTYLERLELRNPLCNGLPATYIASSDPYFPTTASSRDFIRGRAGWTYLEIPTHHNAMTLKPAELSEMLAGIG